MNKKYFVRTFGCQMNEHDSERIASVLETDGMVAASELDEADVIVFNTCCIRENADNKLYGTLGHAKAIRDRNPNLKIMVAGCLAQKDRELIQKRAPWVDVVFGTNNVSRAAELLKYSEDHGSILEIFDEISSEEVAFASALNAVRVSDFQSWVTIQVGCNNNCAFCIVPSVRGKEMSRSFDHIIAEVGSLASQGVTEVTLLGQNVNSYGRDITLGIRKGSINPTLSAGPYWDADRKVRPLFADLLREVGSIPGISRVRFTSPHPKDLRPETIAAMAETAAVCEHLHLPLQSGSDRVLSLMHRGYDSARYLEKLAMARAAIPDLAVTTDIIVGFPGETEEDFERTLEVAAEAAFDGAYTFIFSARPGTEAASMTEDFVSEDVIADRFERLKIVIDRSALRKHTESVGKVEEVLVEGRSKKNSDLWSGRTRGHKLVHFSVPFGIDALNSSFGSGSYANVRIDSAASYFLRGELVSTLRNPKRKKRLDVSVG
ncbi:MAG: MiaB/RimO family radical SAM methylthiotransferase [Actinomycetota bacterium]|nr:MiaB/RimO family radical SAM methylthiotransferase [Actinomycetota bacterium]